MPRAETGYPSHNNRLYGKCTADCGPFKTEGIMEMRINRDTGALAWNVNRRQV